MTERKKILNLMKELSQNPSARKAYRQNPQTLLNTYEFEGNTRDQLLAGDWQKVSDTFNDTKSPFVIMIDAPYGMAYTIKGMHPRYN